MTPEAAVLAAVKRAAKAHGLPVIRCAFGPGVEVGWPDVIVVGRNGRMLWLELKAPGQKLRPIQVHRAAELAKLGHDVRWVDSVAAAREAVEGFFYAR